MLLSTKLMESKSFICLKGGEPKLVLVGPVISEIGLFDSEHVAVFLDEDGPHIISRSDLREFLIDTNCVPLEEMTNWKNRIH